MKKPLTKDEIRQVQGMLCRMCEFFGMELGVLCMQGKDGPLEVFKAHCDDKWKETVDELAKRMRSFAAETQSQKYTL